MRSELPLRSRLMRHPCRLLSFLFGRRIWTSDWSGTRLTLNKVRLCPVCDTIRILAQKRFNWGRKDERVKEMFLRNRN